MMSLWRLREFRVFYALSVSAWLAFGFYSFLMPLLVLERTGSVFAMSVARSMEFLPNILLGLLFGVIIDHWNPKKILLFGLFGQMVFSILIILILYTDANWLIYTGIFAFMVFNLIFNNARTAVVKLIVKREMAINAVSVFQVTNQFVKTVSPVLAGALTLFVAYRTGLYVTCGIFAIALFLSFKLDVLRNFQGKPLKLNLRKIFIEPFLMLRASPRLVRFTVLYMFFNLIEASSSVTYIYILKSVLLLSNEMIGVALSVAGLGAIFGAAISPKSRKIWGEDGVVKTVIFITALCYIILVFALNLPIVLFCIFVQNMCFMIVMLFLFSVRQEEATHQNIGRLTGATTVVFNAVTPFGVPLVGALVAGLGVYAAFVFFVCLCAAAYFIFRRMSLPPA